MYLPIGKRIGPYEILAPIGAGGMGEVYRARDRRLGREVALKVLPADFSQDPKWQARFAREARAASALNHPNIVAIYDLGRADGISYIVSELVNGESLRKTIGRGPMPAATLAALGAQIAHGIAAAHSASIVHRDLKPENIMLTRDGRIKVLDFGLAKQTGVPPGESGETQPLTDPGVIMGTVGYMSPEQARGQMADHRSDIFSIGAILYEMAAAKRPFVGPSFIEILHAILTQNPPPLPESLPASLRGIIGRCLEKDPGRRFQSASDLAFSLDQTTEPRDRIVPPPAAPTKGRRPTWLAAVGLCAAVAVVGVTYWTGLRRSVVTSAPASATAVVPAAIVPTPVPVVSVPSKAAPRAVKAPSPAATPSMANGAKPAQPGTVSSPPNATDEASARTSYDEGGKSFNQRNYSSAVSRYNESIRLDPNRADTWRMRGISYYWMGQYERAIPDLTEAIRLDPENSDPRSFRGVCYRRLGDYDKALADASEVIRLRPRAGTGYRDRGVIYYEQQQYEKALPDFDKAIQVADSDRSRAILCAQRGDAYFRLKRYERALEDYNEAIRLRTDVPDFFNKRAAAKEALGDQTGADADRRFVRDSKK